MSTLINLVIAIAASMLSITGVHRDKINVPETEIMQCQQNIENMNMHFIIDNEQLYQKIK